MDSCEGVAADAPPASKRHDYRAYHWPDLWKAALPLHAPAGATVASATPGVGQP